MLKIKKYVKQIFFLGCDEMLANLTKEKNWLNDRNCAKQEMVADSNQMTEIVEPYDPEKEAAWKGTLLNNIFLI